MSESPMKPMPEPREGGLTRADDRLRLNHRMPPRLGIAPLLRIGVQAFNKQYPGIAYA